MPNPTIEWEGASGRTYTYWISPIGGSYKNEPGNYIFAERVAPNEWRPLYIGQTADLGDRLPDHEALPCVNRNGGTHIHAHTTPQGEEARRAEEADLLRKWNPVCNDND